MRRLVLLVSAVVLVDTMFFAAIAPLLPEYRAELDLTKAAAGGLSAAYAAGTLLAARPAGRLAGRIGGRATVLAGLALLVGSSVVFGFGRDIVLLDTARFAQGVGGACLWAGGFSWLVGAAPRERRGEMIGTALGAAVVGVLLGPVLGGLATRTSPELVFSGVAALGVLLAACALATPAGPTESGAGWRELGAALRRRPVLAAAWLVTLPAVFSGAINVLVPLRLDALGAGGLLIGAAFLAAAAVEAVLNPAARALLAPPREDASAACGPRRGRGDGVPPPAARRHLAAHGRAGGARGFARDVLDARGGAALGVIRGRGARSGTGLWPDEPGVGPGTGGGRSGGRRQTRRRTPSPTRSSVRRPPPCSP